MLYSSDNVSPDLHPGGDNLQNPCKYLPVQHPNHQTHRSNSFLNQWRCGEFMKLTNDNGCEKEKVSCL